MSDSNAFLHMQRVLSEQLGALDERLTGVSMELVHQFTHLRTDLMARIDRLQDALTEQRGSAVVTFGAAERAEKVAKEMGDGYLSLGEQMTALARIVRRLETRVDQLEKGREEGSPQ